METANNNQSEFRKHKYRSSQRGRIAAGFIIVVAGSVLLAKQLGVVMPSWLFTWQMLLIVIGLFSGVKHGFKRGGWFIPLGVGLIFMIDEFIPGISIGHLFWPILIIIIGLVMILRPKKHHCEDNKWRDFKNHHERYTLESNTNERIDAVSIFGGVKKNIISKDFKGGEVTCIFGGAEINLSQADINGKVILEVTQVFGGTRIIVPSHWQVQPEAVVALLGSVEDKRPQQINEGSNDKILILKGTTIFGGIEIQSY